VRETLFSDSEMAGKRKYRYELRKIEDSDHDKRLNLSIWDFTNGVSISTSPMGDSDKSNFPQGTIVLCRVRIGEGAKEGISFTEGFAKVTGFSDDGFPIEFGESLSNPRNGSWYPPMPNEAIYDTREEG